MTHRPPRHLALALAFSLLPALSAPACDPEDPPVDMSPEGGGSALPVDMAGPPDASADMEAAGTDMGADVGGAMGADMGAPMGADMGAQMGADMGAQMGADMSPPDMALPPQCLDGVDNDADGLMDYPRDPGCEGAEDAEEADPAAFACEDGVDNDGDGDTDLDDLSCGAPTDPSEASACAGREAVEVSYTRRAVTSSEGAPARFEACRSNDAPEQVFVFTLRQPVSYLYLSTAGSGFDTLMSVRRSCDDPASEVACNDDAGGARSSAVQLDNPALGEYFIIVDGYAQEQGLVVLTVEAGVADGEPCPPEGGAVTCARGSACAGEVGTPEGVCARAVCADGEDNDADGRVDFPNDPGCRALEGQAEEDPATPPQCADGVDNDRDGRTDHPSDPQCASAADEREAPDPQCADGLDNDQDGYIDAADPGCADAGDSSELNPPACSDGADNDADGRVDYPNDPGCPSPTALRERDPNPLPQCADGLDNDQDGLTDYPDDAGSCTAAADPTEDDACARRPFRDVSGFTSARGNSDPAAGGGAANDFAGTCGGAQGPEDLLVWRVEPDRPLASLNLTSENSDVPVALYARDACGEGAELACSVSSGVSPLRVGARAAGEDVYIFVDSRLSAGGIWRVQLDARLAAGARCDGGLTWRCEEGAACLPSVDGVSRCVVPQCADGLDNNSDGRADYPNDPGCDALTDDLERAPLTPPACANDVDDDGDGLFDFGEDPDCASASDDLELPACRDGVDNDGDGRVDFTGSGLADSSCSCPNDPTEGAAEPACADGCDNDSDGLVDLQDPGCASVNDSDEYNEPACRDGRDNDSDGVSDYPNDPGCESLNDLSELNPTPLPACANGVDDDGDGLIDFRVDDGCVSASDTAEESACDLEVPLLPSGGVVQGNTATLTGTQVGSCSFGAAPEAIWRVRLSAPATLTLDTLGGTLGPAGGAPFTTVLYARAACRPTLPCAEPGCVPAPSELACVRGPAGSSALTFEAPAGDTFLFVDGFGAQSGPYELRARGQYALNGACALDVPFVVCPAGSECRAPAEGEPLRCLTP